jgi:hypothetical protein
MFHVEEEEAVEIYSDEEISVFSRNPTNNFIERNYNHNTLMGSIDWIIMCFYSNQYEICSGWVFN